MAVAGERENESSLWPTSRRVHPGGLGVGSAKKRSYGNAINVGRQSISFFSFSFLVGFILQIHSPHPAPLCFFLSQNTSHSHAVNLIPSLRHTPPAYTPPAYTRAGRPPPYHYKISYYKSACSPVILLAARIPIIITISVAAEMVGACRRRLSHRPPRRAGGRGQHTQSRSRQRSR